MASFTLREKNTNATQEHVHSAAIWTRLCPVKISELSLAVLTWCFPWSCKIIGAAWLIDPTQETNFAQPGAGSTQTWPMMSQDETNHQHSDVYQKLVKTRRPIFGFPSQSPVLWRQETQEPTRIDVFWALVLSDVGECCRDGSTNKEQSRQKQDSSCGMVAWIFTVSYSYTSLGERTCHRGRFWQQNITKNPIFVPMKKKKRQSYPKQKGSHWSGCRRLFELMPFFLKTAVFWLVSH